MSLHHSISITTPNTESKSGSNKRRRYAEKENKGITLMSVYNSHYSGNKIKTVGRHKLGYLVKVLYFTE